MAIDKAVDSSVLDAGLTSVANAIRTKGGTSADLAFPTGFVNAIGAIPTGGGGGVEEKDVNFIDYDGTILHSYTAQEASALSALPANPSHTGLTAQGWNWTLSEIKAQLTACPGGDVWVGQMYVTDDGKTRLYITLKDLLRPVAIMFKSSVSGGVTINWGDGSAEEMSSGTSLATYYHSYSSVGDYVITLDVTNGYMDWTAGSNSQGMMQVENKARSQNVYNSSRLSRVEIGTGITSIGSNWFSTHYNLCSITIPKNITSFGANAFSGNLYSLKHLTIPNTIGSEITNYLMQGLVALKTLSLPGHLTKLYGTARGFYSLISITIPYRVTELAYYDFSACYGLDKVVMPNSITKIGAYAFYNCYRLVSTTIPASVTSIDGNAFNGCYGIKEFHLLPTTPPTLANTNAFGNTANDKIIYVPYSADHSVLNAYKTASQWSNYASLIQEEPQ